MKRVTFVFVAIISITAIVLLTENKAEKQSTSIVKVDQEKQQASVIYK